MIEKPWGSYQDIHREDTLVLKRIYIQPKQRLSLQSHRNRSEFWIVAKGECIAEVDSHLYRLSTGATMLVKKYAEHRIINDGTDPCEIIELQYGQCLEVDITRYEDDYNRDIADPIPF
jgi:mannose-6-phosphate isomerase-like protein (cupin superfamily)